MAAAMRIAFGEAVAILSVVTCACLAVRKRWPSLGIRVATSSILVIAFLMSPQLVAALADPALHRGYDSGLWFHPGLGILVGPAFVALFVAAVFWKAVLSGSASRGAA